MPSTTALRQTLWRLVRKARRLPWLLRTLGATGTLHYAYQTLIKPSWRRSTQALKIDVFDFYQFLDDPRRDAAQAPEAPAEAVAPPPWSFNWVIPDFQVGSGGHRTIFRMVAHLERRGCRQRLIIVGPTQFKSGAAAKEVICRHFEPLEAEVALGEEALTPAEFTVATGWQTAYAVERFGATRHKVYFVQDFEPWFFPVGSEYAFAEATYRFGFSAAITAGDWLAETMAGYGIKAYPFSFSYDKHHHYPRPRRDRIQRVFFYARHVTPRRGFELGLLALGRVHAVYPDLHVVLAGWDSSGYHMPFIHLNAGVVSAEELAELYSQCDVGLVLSLTNISLLPLELMACGCPVVSNNGRNVDWLLRHEDNALLADPTPQALAAALLRVLGDEDLAAGLRTRGLAFAKATAWETEAERVCDYFHQVRGSQRGEETGSGLPQDAPSKALPNTP
ncbi:MAG: glycosyltransferase family 4 protein [Candidatus Competibacterales bacterium]